MIENNLTTDEKPKVSVIIPTFNRCHYLIEAVDSVLAQTYENIEVIVIDDGSTDGTNETLKDRYGEKIIYFWQENRGESVARNLGVSIAKGEYIAFVDSDDLWLPGKLSRQMSILRNDPEIAAVFCEAWVIDQDGIQIQDTPIGVNRRTSDFVIENLFIRNIIPLGASTCLMRRTAFEILGGFPGDIRFGEDWELWLKIILNYRVLFLNEPLCSWRRHLNSQSSLPDITQVDGKLNDYLILLERIKEKYPDRIPDTLYDRSMGYQYLYASLGSYIVGSIEKGKNRLEKAVQFDPETLLNREKFLGTIRVFTTSYAGLTRNQSSVDTIQNFKNALCSNLPDIFSTRNWRHSIKAALDIETGYHLNSLGCNKPAAKAMMHGICSDPLNISLSTLSVMVTPLLGSKNVNRIRHLRHKTQKQK